MKKFLAITSTTFLLTGFTLTAAVVTDTSLVDDDENYRLLIITPDDYNDAQPYPLVVGLQPCNGAPIVSYSNRWSSFSDSLKIIVACPEVLTFNNGWLGDDQWGIITASIDSAMALYNINPSAIYLSGMSCNGYYALRQGANNLYPFKGIFPYAPYLSSVNPAEVNLDTDMPVTIAVGTKDEFSYNAILNLYDSLKNHGAEVNLVLIPDVTHTFDFPGFSNEMIHCIHYLNDTNQISIECPETPLSDIEMMNTDGPRELTFKIAHKTGNEMIVSSLSSNVVLIPNPEITYTPEDSTVVLTFAPQPGRSGKAVMVLEAREKYGSATEQITFIVRVTKYVALDIFKTNSGSIEIFPNPANNYLNINTSGSGNLIELIDITGKVLFSHTMRDNNHIIDVEDYARGIYFIRITGAGFCELRKVMIE